MKSASPITCLIVDDQEPLRETLRRVLEPAGYQCLLAKSGIDALGMLEQTQVPIVISDIQMPEMDGVTLLGKIRERWPDIAVVVVTAVTEVNVAVACLQMGALDYILKPFQVDEVRARVEQALEKRRLILENREYQTHLADLVQQQAQRIEELFLEGVQALVEALEAKDAYTLGHSIRVSAYASKIAAEMGMGDLDIKLIELGAELHDVGKIGVRESVLLKPSALTRVEYDHLMQHTVIGAQILEPLLKNAPQALAIVRSHHEWMDGSGTPDGLSGGDIPLHARVVSVADAFDAMTSARPYRPAMSPSIALQELRGGTGKQFDVVVVAAFLSAYADPAALPIETPDKVRRRPPKWVAAGLSAPSSS